MCKGKRTDDQTVVLSQRERPLLKKAVELGRHRVGLKTKTVQRGERRVDAGGVATRLTTSSVEQWVARREPAVINAECWTRRAVMQAVVKRLVPRPCTCIPKTSSRRAGKRPEDVHGGLSSPVNCPAMPSRSNNASITYLRRITVRQICAVPRVWPYLAYGDRIAQRRWAVGARTSNATENTYHV
eukprot:SAG31_NODE_892_length_11180_cov_22.596426_9_plen_185_part_00